MTNGRIVRSIALILASGFVLSLPAAEPPPDLLRQIALKESANAKARDNYTYRQTFMLQEIDHRDIVVGEFRDTRDITFSPNGARYEQVVTRPLNTLTRIKLTPEDFADVRSVQPFFLTAGEIWQYNGEYKGEEPVNGTPCFVEHVGPKQMLAGNRYFEGLIWIRESDLQVLRTQGQAVPQIETLQKQDLFPHFTTDWEEVDGKWWFPERTYADDTLFFRDWPQRIRIEIRYENYKRFGVESTMTFDGAASPTTQ